MLLAKFLLQRGGACMPWLHMHPRGEFRDFTIFTRDFDCRHHTAAAATGNDTGHCLFAFLSAGSFGALQVPYERKALQANADSSKTVVERSILRLAVGDYANLC